MPRPKRRQVLLTQWEADRLVSALTVYLKELEGSLHISKKLDREVAENALKLAVLREKMELLSYSFMLSKHQLERMKKVKHQQRPQHLRHEMMRAGFKLIYGGKEKES